MIGIEIMTHELPSVYRALSSKLRKMVESFLPLVSSEVNHTDHLIQLLRGKVILFLPRKGEFCNSPKWNFITVPGEGGRITE